MDRSEPIGGHILAPYCPQLSAMGEEHLTNGDARFVRRLESELMRGILLSAFGSVRDYGYDARVSR